MLISFAVSAVHKETKQFFTLYNTLDDRKVYLEKEVKAFVWLCVSFFYYILKFIALGAGLHMWSSEDNV